MMNNVETLVLSDNPIKELNSELFTSNIPEVKHLFLSRCGLKEFSDYLFGIRLSNLVTLDLSYNLIGEDFDEFSDGYSESFSDKKYGKYTCTSYNHWILATLYKCHISLSSNSLSPRLSV